MKVTLRKSAERGFFDHGWLKTWHSFSFADYFDPKHMGYRTLRVINQDIVAPSSGFPMHSHRDMEIITVVLRGEIEHKDSMGNHVRIKAGEVQRMTAGSGVRHSEFNPSDSNELELLQIWIEPEQKGLKPSYEQKELAKHDDSPLRLLIQPQAASNPMGLSIHQDVWLYYLKLKAGQSLKLPLAQQRGGWLQVIDGQLVCLDLDLSAGDGVALSECAKPEITAGTAGASALFFDLP